MDQKVAAVAQSSLRFVRLAGAALDLQGKRLKEALAREKAAAERVPGVVKLLIERGVIKEADEKQATEQLLSHEGALDAIVNMIESDSVASAEEKVANSVGDLGRGVSHGPGVAATPPAFRLKSDEHRPLGLSAADAALLHRLPNRT